MQVVVPSKSFHGFPIESMEAKDFCYVAHLFICS